MRASVRLLALLLAVLLLAFEIEPFEEEYEESHPAAHHGATIDRPASTWETCDKEQGAQALVVIVDSHPLLVCILPPLPSVDRPVVDPAHPVRDKSPPTGI